MELVLLIFCITLLILVALICANLVKKGGALDEYGNEMDIEILLDTTHNSLNSIQIDNLAGKKFDIYTIYELRAIALSLIKHNYMENTSYYNRYLKLKEADCIGSNMSYELIIENVHVYGEHSKYKHVNKLGIALRLIDDEINKVKEVINSANIVVNIDNDEIKKKLAPLYETFDKFKTIINNNNVILNNKLLGKCMLLYTKMLEPLLNNEEYISYSSLLESIDENIYQEIEKIKRIITTVPKNIIAKIGYFIDIELEMKKNYPILTSNKRFIERLESPVAFEDLSHIFETLYLEHTFNLFHKLILSEPSIKTIVSFGSRNAALEFLFQKWLKSNPKYTQQRDWILIDPDETSFGYDDDTIFIKPDYKYCDDMLKTRPDLRQNCILLLNCIDPHQTEETAYDLQCVKILKPRCIFFITNTEFSCFTSGTSYLKNYLDSPSSDYKLTDMYENKHLNDKQAALVFKSKDSIFPPIKPNGEIFSLDQKIKR